MNFRRLRYFVKIVDIGSVTQAADLLHVAQPSLSQQMATLEGEVRQQLLLRTKQGVIPTEAGKVLYRHAQAILRQVDQAKVEMKTAGQGLSGAVSVGLAPGTAAAALALPLLRTVRARHPGILLYLNESYGSTLSELIMNGRMDMAVLYGGKTPVHGLSFLPLLKEPLYVVGPESMPAPPDEVPLPMLGDIDLYLARPYNVVRRLVDEAFNAIGMAPRVLAEIESASTLKAIVADGLGATILPASMAREVAMSCDAWQCRIVEPVIEAPLALCQSGHQPLSEPAQAIKEILLELVAGLAGNLLLCDRAENREAS
ncbi:nitrogen assimilation transcriptional regulator NAC [Cupriavidus sp. CuC1]|uniref:nitrogen assimilation transcriptional regulator NAC n=1 Tax=Cupriavidus sp. CuC1 TaxID=3373131 RepID=UPI0037D14140